MFVALMFCGLSSAAQHTITGTVTKAKTGEPMVGARVMIVETYAQVFTNARGEFRLTGVPKGTNTIVATYLGYEDFRKEVEVFSDMTVNVQLNRRLFMAPEVVVSSTRAQDRTPVTSSEMKNEDIAAANTGKDLPFLLGQMPSTVVTSDAGTGVGYTSMRIRGSDITRINVTVNGIPLNDAESHGVWWVDLPDITSSTESIQVQRGVGTSTLGAGAFGATVNLQTHGFHRDPYGEISTTYGSFNTSKATVQLGSGLVKNRWTFDGRLSRIKSDGFIDRATANLGSWFFSSGYHGKRNLITANIFSGHEITYQAWYGVPQDSLESNPTFNPVTYDNEVDDYKQTHYQLLWSHDLTKGFYLSAAAHYTKGAGFYEQFRTNESFSRYGFDTLFVGNDTITSTDLIRRRWLDNDFYGGIASVHYDPGQRVKAIVGGGWNNYMGNHFGEVIWARFASNSDISHRYYDNEATKSDLNVFAKAHYQLTNRIGLFGDLQYRQVDYTFLGFDDSLMPATQNVIHNFINPKGGFTIDVGSTGVIYGSVAVAHREPVRDDYVESNPATRPRSEQLTDAELGYRLRLKRVAVVINGFYMLYKDQLVLTGQINDVGAYTRRNVPESYRTGGELEWSARIIKGLTWHGNFTYSMNKIPSYTEFIDDYDDFVQDSIVHENTDIAFSPAIVSSSRIAYSPLKGLTVNVITKYVGTQFLDNTSNPDRSLDAYLINDVRINYEFKGSKGLHSINLMAAMYNLVGQVYASNGYTYSYISGAETYTENYVYPQAGRHFMVGGSVRF